MEFLLTAQQYHAAGLAVMPANRDGDDKRVALRSWKPFQTRLPLPTEIEAWFSGNGHNAVCIATGDGSGNLEMIDFDQQGELFDAWAAKIDPDLFARLYVESTPSGGRHVVYRCQTPICKNIKLAQRKVSAPGPEPVTIKGKTLKPRKDGDGWVVTLTLIETRGHKGMFLCAPSPGYETMQGDLADLPVITEAQRDALMIAADSLNEVRPEPVKVPGIKTSATLRPGDDYSARGDVEGLLVKHGWVKVRDQDNEYWRRPGKNTSWSATLKDRVFYVHSSNAAPFEADKAYGPFAVYALLEHGGDFTAAANALRGQGYGDSITVTAPQPAEKPDPNPDPGDLPVELLRVPGFISEVMDHCMATAPYPNHAMAFCGALALQSFLAGRKVRDQGNIRTNLYLLGLAFSGSGKDWPRKVNTHILHEIGLINCLGDRFASGEGLQDALYLNPAMLFQTDEIDALMRSIKQSRDGRMESITSTLMTLYTSSSSIVPMRVRAGQESRDVINQPSLTIFGTATPNLYYESLSKELLENGFFSRMIVVEGGPRADGQEPSEIDPSPRVMETAKWWANFCPGGNIGQFINPSPIILERTPDATEAMGETHRIIQSHYREAESNKDGMGTSVWARTEALVRQLALIYAASENFMAPSVINKDAVLWASRFMLHQTRRAIFQAKGRVAENPFDAECQKVIQKLRDAGGELSYRLLLRRMHLKKKHFDEVLETLVESGMIEELKEQNPGGGWLKRGYRLVR